MKKVLTVFIILATVFLGAGCVDGKEDAAQPKNVRIRIGAQTFEATLLDNESAAAFYEMLPVAFEMNELNGNEKYFYLDRNLPKVSYRPDTVREGDLMLFGSDCIVLFYKSFSSPYSYTGLGKIEDTAGLKKALGEGNVVVGFEPAVADES